MNKKSSITVTLQEILEAREQAIYKTDLYMTEVVTREMYDKQVLANLVGELGEKAVLNWAYDNRFFPVVPDGGEGKNKYAVCDVILGRDLLCVEVKSRSARALQENQYFSFTKRVVSKILLRSSVVMFCQVDLEDIKNNADYITHTYPKGVCVEFLGWEQVLNLFDSDECRCGEREEQIRIYVEDISNLESLVADRQSSNIQWEFDEKRKANNAIDEFFHQRKEAGEYKSRRFKRDHIRQNAQVNNRRLKGALKDAECASSYEQELAAISSFTMGNLMGA